MVHRLGVPFGPLEPAKEERKLLFLPDGVSATNTASTVLKSTQSLFCERKTPVTLGW
jgi:hypothetical protein